MVSSAKAVAVLHATTTARTPRRTKKSTLSRV
jgi:hypothetical protein